MPKPTPQELAGMTQQFLARVQLSGQEVPAYTHVMNWLETFTVDADK